MPVTFKENFVESRQFDSMKPLLETNVGRTWGETFKSAFRTENITGSYFTAMKDMPTYPTPEEFKRFISGEYDPYKDLAENYELDPMLYPQVYDMELVTPEQTQWIANRIKKEEEDRLTLAEAGEMKSFAAITASVLLDPASIPLYMIPMFGVSSKVAGAGRSLAMVAEGGIVSGASAGAAELALHDSQLTRTAEESAYAVGASVLIGSVLGGAYGIADYALKNKEGVKRAYENARREYEDIKNGMNEPTDTVFQGDVPFLTVPPRKAPNAEADEVPTPSAENADMPMTVPKTKKEPKKDTETGTDTEPATETAPEPEAIDPESDLGVLLWQTKELGEVRTIEDMPIMESFRGTPHAEIPGFVNIKDRKGLTPEDFDEFMTRQDIKGELYGVGESRALTDLKVGDSFKLDDFTSFSRDTNVAVSKLGAERTFFRIQDANSKAKTLITNPKEAEVIYARGSKFKVENIQRNITILDSNGNHVNVDRFIDLKVMARNARVKKQGVTWDEVISDEAKPMKLKSRYDPSFGGVDPKFFDREFLREHVNPETIGGFDITTTRGGNKIAEIFKGKGGGLEKVELKKDSAFVYDEEMDDMKASLEIAKEILSGDSFLNFSKRNPSIHVQADAGARYDHPYRGATDPGDVFIGRGIFYGRDNSRYLVGDDADDDLVRNNAATMVHELTHMMDHTTGYFKPSKMGVELWKLKKKSEVEWKKRVKEMQLVQHPYNPNQNRYIDSSKRLGGWIWQEHEGTIYPYNMNTRGEAIAASVEYLAINFENYAFLRWSAETGRLNEQGANYFSTKLKEMRDKSPAMLQLVKRLYELAQLKVEEVVANARPSIPASAYLDPFAVRRAELKWADRMRNLIHRGQSDENRIDLKATFLPKIGQYAFDYVMDNAINRDYAHWMMKELVNELDNNDTDLEMMLREEVENVTAEIDKYSELLGLFDKYKKELPVGQRDIHSIKSHYQLQEIVSPFREKERQKELAKINKKEIAKEIEFFAETPEYSIRIPKTEKASCYLGQGTKWCVAATESENAFDWYNATGKLYFIQIKGSGRKYAFHISDGFRDDTDEIIVDPINEGPKLADATRKILKEFTDDELIDYLIQSSRVPIVKYVDNPGNELLKKAILRDRQNLLYDWVNENWDTFPEEIKKFIVETNRYGKGTGPRVMSALDARKNYLEEVAIRPIHVDWMYNQFMREIEEHRFISNSPQELNEFKNRYANMAAFIDIEELATEAEFIEYIESGRFDQTMNQFGHLEAEGDESRINLKATFERRIGKGAFDYIMDSASNRDYAHWIMKQFVRDINDQDIVDMERVWRDESENVMESIDMYNELLDLYDKYKKELPVERRNIHKIWNKHDLKELVEQFKEKERQKELARMKKDEIAKEIEFFSETPEYNIYIPKTEKASCYLGQGTKWCTAATKSQNLFNQFNDKGNLYYIQIKGGRKYAFHQEDNLRNAADAPAIMEHGVSLDGSPELKSAMNEILNSLPYYTLKDISEHPDTVHMIGWMDNPSNQLIKTAAANDEDETFMWYVKENWDNFSSRMKTALVDAYLEGENYLAHLELYVMNITHTQEQAEWLNEHLLEYLDENYRLDLNRSHLREIKDHLKDFMESERISDESQPAEPDSDWQSPKSILTAKLMAETEVALADALEKGTITPLQAARMLRDARLKHSQLVRPKLFETFKFLSPQMRLATSSSPLVRWVTERTFEDNYLREANRFGETSGPAIETLAVARAEELSYKAINIMREGWKAQKGSEVGGSFHISKADFGREVYKHWIGDIQDGSVASKVANDLVALHKEVEEEMVELEIIPSTDGVADVPPGDKRYAPRIWDMEAIQNNPTAFKNKVKDYIKRSNLSEGEEVLSEVEINEMADGMLEALSRSGIDMVRKLQDTAMHSSLRQRSVNLPTQEFSDYLISDPVALAMGWYRTMIPIVELQKRWGDWTLKPLMDDINQEYRHLIEIAETEKQKTKLLREQGVVERDLNAMRDIMLRKYGIPDHQSIFNDANSFIRAWNFVTMMGGVVITSTTDLGTMIYKAGFTPMAKNMVAMISDVKNWNMSREEMKQLGAGLDIVLHTRARSLMGSMDDGISARKLITGMEKLSGVASNLVLLSPWNSAMKQFVSVALMDTMSKKITRYKISKKDMVEFAPNGNG